MMSFAQRYVRPRGLLARILLPAVAGLAGCASPGPPRAPSLRLPGEVKNLAAERRGPTVVVHFSAPTRTTDDMELTSPVRGKLCRAVADGPCVATASFPGLAPVAGDVVWTDMLPAELAVGAPRKLSYRVQMVNTAGRTAGWSDAVAALAGEAPHTVDGLRAEGARGGVVLRWTAEAPPSGDVLLERKALPGGPAAIATKKPDMPAKGLPMRRPRVAGMGAGSGSAAVAQAKNKDTVWLRAGAVVHDSGGTLDATAVVDQPYSYSALRSRTVTVDGASFEMRSAPSATVEITLRDVYPPAIPTGLLAAAYPVEGSQAVAVDLVWQPNVESDLAGYNVYRQTLTPDGKASEATKLNGAPVALPAFHDANAAHGTRYRYTVVAVDVKGNASPASAAAELETAP